MSTALVSSTALAPATARVASVRVGNATSYSYVDPLETSVGARPGDQSVRYDERWTDLQGYDQAGHGQQRDRSVRFGGIFVSREVGTAIMQAQAQQASRPQSSTVPEAEKQIRVYEFNQSLMGTPEAVTSVGVARF